MWGNDENSRLLGKHIKCCHRWTMGWRPSYFPVLLCKSLLTAWLWPSRCLFILPSQLALTLLEGGDPLLCLTFSLRSSRYLVPDSLPGGTDTTVDGFKVIFCLIKAFTVICGISWKCVSTSPFVYYKTVDKLSLPCQGLSCNEKLCPSVCRVGCRLQESLLVAPRCFDLQPSIWCLAITRRRASWN